MYPQAQTTVNQQVLLIRFEQVKVYGQKQKPQKAYCVKKESS
jgi:hypothetical protein